VRRHSRTLNCDTFAGLHRLFIHARVQSLLHVDDLAFTRKDVRPRAQIVVLVASEVMQKVAIRALRGINVRFVRKA